MTIKPVTSQKASEKKDQEPQSSTARGANHRVILATKSSSESQRSPQRRNDVFDEILRHRRSPHKSSGSIRSKRDHRGADHHKRDTREKHIAANSHQSSSVVSSKSPKHVHGTTVGQSSAGGAGSTGPVASPADLLSILEEHRDVYSGYNSGDEHLVPKEQALTEDEWKHRDEQFMKAMAERGLVVQDIAEDGACLFRAISLQIFGDQEMHEVIRQQTMDYIYQNREYFAHFVTEDITSYVKRKRNKDSHGNHIEIQAMSEIYNRSVELYCYQTTPTNIFNSEQINNGYDPLRLSYQRGSHYNAILDPYNASVGVGLGLAGYKPESQTREAIRLSEQQEIEQTMFEDKLKTTDWEATNEAIEEQIARESYLQWCRDNTQAGKTTTTTVTRSTSTASSTTNSTILSSTITSASIKSPQQQQQHSAGCGSGGVVDNGKDSMVTAAGMPAGVDSIIMPTVADTLTSGAGDCYDSDDTDMSSTSSTTDTAQMGLVKKRKYAKAAGACGSGKRRGKRRHHGDGNEDSLCSCDSSPCSHKRAKLIKVPSSTAIPVASASDPAVINTAEWSSFDYGGVPGTSKQATQSEKPVSSFYQSLLESSYAEDGLAQMTESEMIVRAIRLSRIDFFERAKRRQREQQTSRQQHPQNGTISPDRDICNSSRQQQHEGSSAERPQPPYAKGVELNEQQQHESIQDYEDDDSDVASP